MLTDISKHFRKEKEWIVIEMNPERDLLYSLLQNYMIKRN